ncbi:hypothetical protein RJ639_041347 [Escallonia herrerae]|uniref:Uncharacterized protein n=1 Tax=Escallonia herrerae TaxID=1293975 RepID=A0AA88WCX0_9ASTE|nr:hypothetical protein RJ639_041347 [Escallonia herrerae]
MAGDLGHPKRVVFFTVEAALTSSLKKHRKCNVNGATHAKTMGKFEHLLLYTVRLISALHHSWPADSKIRSVGGEKGRDCYLDFMLFKAKTLSQKHLAMLLWELTIQVEDNTMITVEWAMYELTKNTKSKIAINIYECIMDDKVWEHPEEWMPKRFLDENNDSVDLYKTIAFGGEKEAPMPINVVLAINHSVVVKGDHTNFEIEPSFGVEASELYPDMRY